MSTSWHPRAQRLLWIGGLLLVAALLLPGASLARWIDLGGDGVAIELLESDAERSVIAITVGGFEATPVAIGGETYYQIHADGAHVQHEAGLPALPDVRRSLRIPDDRAMEVRVLRDEYVDLPALPVAPSKGHLPRSIDPASVPYTFDAFYAGAGTYPPELAAGETPYILRDWRGMIVDANVFQYRAATQELRVHTQLVLEVRAAGAGVTNVIERTAPPQKIDTQFAKLYERQFLNYGGGRYDPVLEDGGLLIIAYDAFLPHVQPLYEWKLQKGMETRLVGLSEIGSSSSAIDSYIEQQYNDWGPAYVLLVGDAAQVPTMSYGNGSDPSYTLVSADDYPDLFIGRFSAENTGQVDTQVARTIHYERDVLAGERWMQSGFGVASAEGPGHHGEYDYQHSDLMRDDLLAYGYSYVDQIYDPGASASEVSLAINDGRGIGNYTGHGSTTSWGTTGFSNSHIDALSNTNMLPFISSVACLNGNFTSSTCFGEAWLRATHNGLPTGAIGVYASTISQSWNPPMDAQDEAVDLLVADQMRTLGGLWFNGSCLMIDLNGTSGVNEFKCWTIFGDPSVAVRTMEAEALTVNHTGVLMLGQDSYDVTVVAGEGALCALYADGELYGRAYAGAGGAATIAMAQPPAEPMTLQLTVTAYNKETYTADVEVIPAAGPYLVIESVVHNDGNGDGILNAGEAVAMNLQLENVGSATAADVSATISNSSEFITLLADTQTFPDVPPSGLAWSEGAYTFQIEPNCPDQEAITFPLAISGEERRLWESSIAFVVSAPEIAVADVLVDDTAGGDGNMRLDPGETALITVTLANGGSYPLEEITGLLACSHPMIEITADTGTHAGLAQDESGALAPAFEIAIDPAYELTEGFFTLEVTGTNDYDTLFDIDLPIGGFYEPVESGAPGWTHDLVLPGFTDDWHISSQRNHSPNGSHSWKCGDAGSGDYSSLLDAGLVSPMVELSGAGELRFWQWIDSEVSSAYPDMAYDGGLVEISIDGGAFVQLTPEGGYPYTIRPGGTPGPFPEDTPVFAGSEDWHQVVFDLSSFTGEAVLRWRFGSDGAVTAEGWYIDDVEIIGVSGFSDVTPVDLRPTQLSLSAPRPNPCGAQTRIAFGLPADGPVELKVYDLAGRLVRTLADGPRAAGAHTVHWHGDTDGGQQAASGIYFYRLQTENGNLRRSLVLMR